MFTLYHNLLDGLNKPLWHVSTHDIITYYSSKFCVWTIWGFRNVTSFFTINPLTYLKYMITNHSFIPKTLRYVPFPRNMGSSDHYMLRFPTFLELLFFLVCNLFCILMWNLKNDLVIVINFRDRGIYVSPLALFYIVK